MVLSISVLNLALQMHKRMAMSLLLLAHNPNRMVKVQYLLVIRQLLMRMLVLVLVRLQMQWVNLVSALVRNQLPIEIIMLQLVRKLLHWA